MSLESVYTVMYIMKKIILIYQSRISHTYVIITSVAVHNYMIVWFYPDLVRNSLFCQQSSHNSTLIIIVFRSQ